MLSTGARGILHGRVLFTPFRSHLPCKHTTNVGAKLESLICTQITPKHKSFQSGVCIRSSSSFSALPPDEEQAEKERVAALTPYQKEIELRKLDNELARLQTLRGINTGELYTLRGKFKMLSRDYGMGFLAWYWTVWFATAGISYAAIEVGGVDPMIVAAKVENFLRK